MDEPAILGVTGSPVFHSLSPELFSIFSRETGMNLRYLKIFSGSAGESILLMRSLPISGINVTAPFKTEIIDHLDHLDVHARNTGAVNLVKKENGGLKGYNTDYFGVVRSLKKKNFKISGKKILVLGAGGAGRAAAYGLKMNGGRVFLFNRNEEKGSRIADRLGVEFISSTKLKEMTGSADLIVDTLPDDGVTSVYKKNFVPLPVFKADYRDPAFRTRGKNGALKDPDGIDWLYFQGEESFRVFFGSGILFPERCYSGFRSMAAKPQKGPDSLFLVGFTGCGKSHTGRALARKTGFDFIDLDAEIEKKEKMTIPELFRLKGEKYFRTIEAEQLRKFSARTSVICSCGGGIVTDPANRRILKEMNTIWVHTGLDEILKRIDTSSRPVLSGISRQEIEALFEKRAILYSEVSKALVGNNRDPDYSAEKIYHEISKNTFGQG